ncbi:MAG: 16S rRNA (uracil(1498)-N(3))-methyltransferase [Clostridia bacterium]|nr:16S rRNA (uracil(1498)-N(3))-methyltransferase [Clostridia bacterium]
MRRFFGCERNGKIYIEGEEFNHLKNVLRMNEGDELLVSLNDEFEYVCEIMKFEKGSAVCKINGKHECEGNPKKNIVIFQAITKGQKFEFIVQKATEIGISKIVPFVSEFVIAKVTEHKMERLNSIALNACKQCERTIVPEIAEPVKVDDVIASFKDFDLVLFANERTDVGEEIKKLSKYKNIAIIVGSEGGFSQKEKEAFIEAGATSVSLGRRIYRCETASVAMMSLVSILSGN